jgi:hypothetical protein
MAVAPAVRWAQTKEGLMRVLDTPRFAAAALTLSLVLGVGCPPPPPPTCTGCTIKQVTYTIPSYPELAAGATITSVGLDEQIEMTGHCHDGTSRSPCPYENDIAMSPRSPGTYTQCMSQSTDADDRITLRVDVRLTERSGSPVTKTESATVSGTCR